MTMLTRTLVGLLVLGAAGHTIGSLKFYKGQPHALFWALCVSVLIVVVAAMNWLRADRPQDLGLAWVTAAATLAYAGISISFGFLIGNPMDWRALSFAAISLALTGLSLRTALS
ncbi:hypothetical protein FHT86_007298 [Rhizobium sp. BK313]|uniref:hypothetical protein n=1 Tax=Rhizobium sp. BK313 TaxID=2587081 RepID=UPI00105F7B8D|nr:hypothetical protein [Rhizobium sp. BK313]MBB3458969.1 hypothetical protein [Rhizobium sp. BK313]